MNHHIVQLIPGLDRIAGAERQTMLLAEGLRRRGWRVTVVALSGTGASQADRLSDAGVDFLCLGMRKGLADPRGWWRFQQWLRRERPNVIHAHLPHAAWFARWSRLAARLFNGPAPFLHASAAPAVPVFVPVFLDTLHSSAAGGIGRRLGYRSSRWLPDCVTAVSRAAAEAHLRAGMVSPSRLEIVQNGVDAEAFRQDPHVRAAARAELGAKPEMEEEFLWLAAGRLDPVKDYPTLLQAMTRVPAPARLLIAGSGPLEAGLRALAGRLGLAERVRFLGFCGDIARWMQAADGFVLASRREGLPMVLLEAAAAGLPAVATDIPGTREAIVDGQTGRLAAPGDPAALAAAMKTIMQLSGAERAAMSAHARQRAVKQFGIEAVLDRWERLYAETMAARARSTARAACVSGSQRRDGARERQPHKAVPPAKGGAAEIP